MRRDQPGSGFSAALRLVRFRPKMSRVLSGATPYLGISGENPRTVESGYVFPRVRRCARGIRTDRVNPHSRRTSGCDDYPGKHAASRPWFSAAGSEVSSSITGGLPTKQPGFGHYIAIGKRRYHLPT